MMDKISKHDDFFDTLISVLRAEDTDIAVISQFVSTAEFSKHSVNEQCLSYLCIK